MEPKSIVSIVFVFVLRHVCCLISTPTFTSKLLSHTQTHTPTRTHTTSSHIRPRYCGEFFEIMNAYEMYILTLLKLAHTKKRPKICHRTNIDHHRSPSMCSCSCTGFDLFHIRPHFCLTENPHLIWFCVWFLFFSNYSVLTMLCHSRTCKMSSSLQQSFSAETRMQDAHVSTHTHTKDTHTHRERRTHT